MGVYQKVCFAVEDIFVRILSGKQDRESVKNKVRTYRGNKAAYKIQKKQDRHSRVQERNQAVEAQKEQEKQRVLAMLSHVVDVQRLNYTQYEFNEVKRKPAFFNSLRTNIFEQGEQGLTFVHCEFDKSKNKEIKGYLIITNKRVLFLDDRQTTVQKYRYQTIRDITWFKDGVLERGLYIQYGVKRLEFDEIYDSAQMKRVGNLIKQLSTQTA
ncbi:PH domain-containing protein [Peribacillus kribbensis]|uniref:PH domain-containing protein n=1 Tax=Peribacillus kribbensis TaxID=356658 RepID=UPI000418166C|nr:PH domain-containing protein [Peribacillus kribbensis]